MIVSDLRHIERRVSMTPELKKAIDFLRRSDLREFRDGKVEIDGERLFALVQRYRTEAQSQPKFEYHRKFIDVQFIVSGEEVIGWAPADRVKVTEAYDPEKDVAFGAVPQNKWTPVFLGAGEAAVLWPEDGHAPKLAAGTPSSVMKIVIKLAV